MKNLKDENCREIRTNIKLVVSSEVFQKLIETKIVKLYCKHKIPSAFFIETKR
jgi:hypothetical protein